MCMYMCIYIYIYTYMHVYNVHIYIYIMTIVLARVEHWEGHRDPFFCLPFLALNIAVMVLSSGRSGPTK